MPCDVRQLKRTWPSHGDVTSGVASVTTAPTRPGMTCGAPQRCAERARMGAAYRAEGARQRTPLAQQGLPSSARPGGKAASCPRRHNASPKQACSAKRSSPRGRAGCLQRTNTMHYDGLPTCGAGAAHRQVRRAPPESRTRTSPEPVCGPQKRRCAASPSLTQASAPAPSASAQVLRTHSAADIPACSCHRCPARRARARPRSAAQCAYLHARQLSSA